MKIKKNQRVYWNDPDTSDGNCSGFGKVVALQYTPIDDDTVISLKMDDGGEVECLRNELSNDEPKPFAPLTVSNSKFRVTFVQLPDEEFLRFDCDMKVGCEWENIEDTSYCTCMPQTTDRKIIKEAAQNILKKLTKTSIRNGSYKHNMELMSWVSPEDTKGMKMRIIK